MQGKSAKEHLLALRIADHLIKSGLISQTQTPTQNPLAAKIEALLAAESQIEMKLEEEVKGMLAKYEKEAGRVDTRKMFFMIKKKLIQDRNLVLQSDPSLSQDDKINHLAHRVQSGILRDPEIEVEADATALLQAIKKGIVLQIEREVEVEALVRNRLATGSVIEGSEEWALIYRRTYDEIARKRGL